LEISILVEEELLADAAELLLLSAASPQFLI
jgi:hypothetical protein